MALYESMKAQRWGRPEALAAAGQPRQRGGLGVGDVDEGDAEFALQDAKWGFHACDGGLIRLPQIVGMGHAMEIILSGERVDADHAYRIGLVNRIVPQASLLEVSLQYAQMLASRSPLSHRFAKEVVKRTVGMHMDEALRLESRSFHDVGLTDDLAEGTTAFRERRDAHFKGS